MLQRGYTREFAEAIYRQIEGFGEYGFPESHAASFALLVYVSAWLKRHEPAAFLAGLLKAPSRYSPVSESERAAARATVVLDQMEETGVITAEQRAAAVLEPVRVSRTLATQHAQYFIDWLDQSIRGLVGEPTEDLVVETTLDLTLQTAAERSVRRILDRDGSKGVQQAALVALDDVTKRNGFLEDHFQA